MSVTGPVICVPGWGGGLEETTPTGAERVPVAVAWRESDRPFAAPVRRPAVYHVYACPIGVDARIHSWQTGPFEEVMSLSVVQWSFTRCMSLQPVPTRHKQLSPGRPLEFQRWLLGDRPARWARSCTRQWSRNICWCVTPAARCQPHRRLGTFLRIIPPEESRSRHIQVILLTPQTQNMSSCLSLHSL